MNITLDVILDKTVLVGLSYFDKHGELLQQKLLSGVVVETDEKKGIAVQLTQDPSPQGQPSAAEEPSEPQHFVLPAALSCWVHAPQGEYHVSHCNSKIKNPDYLVTWDIYQKQDAVDDGDHQWWEWYPRTTPPKVNSPS